MKCAAIFALALCLSACAAPREKTLELEVGMSSGEVRAALGEPDSKRLRNGEECFMYSYWRDFWNRRPGDYSDRYFACFQAGKLASYGRVGDNF